MSNIFVIDDSISVRKALELSLKKEGLNVRTAASAEAALEQMDEPTDLVIADVIMPGLSGFELCQTLKADGRYQHIPVLIISGNVDAETRQQAHDVGAAGVLKKPFRQEELMPAVQHALASAAAPSAAQERQDTALQDEPAAPEAATAAVTPTAPLRTYEYGEALRAMLDRAANMPGVLGTALVERSGEVLERRGEPLPDNIGQFARFYIGTADFLAGQLDERGASQVELELGGKRLTIRFLSDKLLVTLSRL
ncbi:transcriptional regulator [Deinococcus piscis]|uniref:Transcriptional regulator n=1 Tax=Deinococcus piscis TaxID=394230 RepID=A0ABQ3KHY5_9DEIO|nr:response regulator [Deinococcus piscis]GHG11669.1 transcriptional regulator [Deinococcus piscis]